MSKQALVEQVMKNTGMIKKDAQQTVDTVFTATKDVLQDQGELSIVGWGRLHVKDVPARTGRNPQTGEELKIPAKKAVKFKASKNLLDKVK